MFIFTPSNNETPPMGCRMELDRFEDEACHQDEVCECPKVEIEITPELQQAVKDYYKLPRIPVEEMTSEEWLKNWNAATEILQFAFASNVKTAFEKQGLDL